MNVQPKVLVMLSRDIISLIQWQTM
ncbi:hypothetical protein Avbf_01311 [Armadillidium vulgare]|nr:hypothetical protein Avbf_01311 [Armadillidium vulgare]